VLPGHSRCGSIRWALLAACVFHNAGFIQLPFTLFKIGTFIVLFLPFATPILTLHQAFFQYSESATTV
jgi:hypothetical protein